MGQIKALIEKAKSDNELMAKLDALGKKDAGADEIIKLAKEYGFTVTADEIDQLKNESVKTGEIKEEDLEAVAGGGTQNRYDPNTCKGMTRTKYECVGFLSECWCDHYRCVYERKHNDGWTLFMHSCAMEAFPRYQGYGSGNPG